MSVTEIISRFVTRFPREAVLLDSNLLVAYVAAAVGEQWYKGFRRARFSFADTLLLREVVKRYQTIVTTPAVLAETSNLGGYTGDGIAVRAFRAVLAREVARGRDDQSPSIDVVEDELYSALGFCDATLALLGQREVVVMTADVPLYLRLEARQIPCLSFPQIQAAVATLE